MVAEDVAVKQRRQVADRVSLQERIREARPLILPKVKVTVIEVRKAKESNWIKGFQSCKIKKREGRKIHGPGNFTGSKDDK